MNRLAGVGGNVETIVQGIGRAWGNEPNVGHGPRHPGVALVDDAAVFVQLQAAIEVGAGVDRAAVALERAAVKQGPAAIVYRLELDPHVEGIHRAGRKEVPDLPRAHDHLDADGFPAAHVASTRSSGPTTGAGARSVKVAAPKPALSSPTANVLDSVDSPVRRSRSGLAGDGLRRRLLLSRARRHRPRAGRPAGSPGPPRAAWCRDSRMAAPCWRRRIDATEPARSLRPDPSS